MSGYTPSLFNCDKHSHHGNAMKPCPFCRIAELEYQLSSMEKALEGISDLDGLCIFSKEESYRAGSAAAYSRAAEIANTALPSAPTGGHE